MEKTKSTRFHPRVSFKAKVTFKGSKVWLVSEAKNISEGGMYIAPLPNEDSDFEADIEFHIPNKDFPVTAKCVVAWREDDTENAGGGVRFTRLFRMDRELLREYIKKNKKCPI